ncbi:MAG: glycosyltransferase family 39 protein [Elusimicrobia bacterium]|nr:glycosyltransferase family 39 protein [Elusimicrobiota bacterium]
MAKKKREAAATAPPPPPVPETGLSKRAIAGIAVLLVIWACYAGRNLSLPFVVLAWKAFGRGLWVCLTDWNPVGFIGPRLAWAGMLWFVAAGLGGPVCKALGLRGGKTELFLLSAGFGFAGLSSALLGLGLAGLFSPTALKVSFMFVTAGSLLCWYRWFPRPEEPPACDLGAEAKWERGWTWPVLVLLGMAVLLNTLCAAAPEIYYDSLNYHLALPNLYLLQGNVSSTPHQIFSASPFGGQMLYSLAMVLSDEKLASLLHSSFSLAVVGWLYLMARRWFTPFKGWLAGLLYYTLPMGMYSAWSSGVDHIGVFYCCAALFALLRGLEPVAGNGSQPCRGAGWQVGAGILAGAAAGTKYNILTVPVVLACVQFWLGRRERLGWQKALALLGAAGAVFSPWMLKNLAFFGNPLYPFFTGIFPGAERIADPAGFFSASRAMEASAVLSGLGGLKSWVEQQWNVFLGDWPTGDWAGPLLPLFAPWALFVPWKRPVERGLLAVAALGYLSWAATSGLGRFLLPAYPALSLFLAYAVCHSRWPKSFRALGMLAILYQVLFQFQVAFKQSWNMDFWAYLSGRMTKEEFLRVPHETYALPYYTAAQFINRDLPKDARIMVLGESRSFYIERETVASSIFDHNPFWEGVRRSSTAVDIRGELARMGITHILVNAYQYLYRASSPAVLPRDLASSEAYRRFWQEYLEVAFEERHDPNPQPAWLILYKVLPEPRKVVGVHLNPAFFAVRALEKAGR